MDAWERNRERFEVGERPFLARALAAAARERPYRDLRIAHNVPITFETVLKLEVLVRGGAVVTATPTTVVPQNPEAAAILAEAGVTVVPVDAIEGTFDVALDCCGELLGKVTPRLGAAELTGTGAQRYRAADPAFPVVSITDARIKRVEALGTGDSCVRALRELADHLRGGLAARRILLFGYGTIGTGIAIACKAERAEVTIVEARPDAARAAKAAGLPVIDASDRSAVENAARASEIVVTATGVEGVISSSYDVGAFRGRCLANMGALDELGPGIREDEALFAKKPINFALEHPTAMRYLDPVFFAHNLSIDVLRAEALRPGVQPLAARHDDAIVDEWTRLFGARS